jgi:hypothetical protein
LRLQPINTRQTFCAEKTTVKQQNEYTDPLMTWPIRGAAFSNEVGEALRPIVGDVATLSWVPALLYFGADIYDKYKNDKTEYSPDKNRGLEQAIFQGMASITLPLIAVKAGQNLFSLLGIFSSDKLPINTKEHINKLAQQFVANGKMHAYHGKDEECAKEFLTTVANNMNLSDNPYLKTSYTRNKVNINKNAKKTINNLISLRKNMLNPSKEFLNNPCYKHYKIAINKGQTKNVAIKSALTKELQNDALKGNLLKTLGGFVALGLSIKPIDNFVEHTLIEKIIAPKLNKKRTD